MDNYNYPLGSDTPDAPWNEKKVEEKEIEVTVSITLSKNTTIKVSDYKIIDSGIDEDGNYFEEIDYSNCNLEKAVRRQIELPHAKDAWDEDDFEVMIGLW